MSTFSFSLGRSIFDNQPQQRSSPNLDDFFTVINSTGSTRKGEAYICAPMGTGLHPDPAKHPGIAHWRSHKLAQPRRFLALDGDYFSGTAAFDAFRAQIARWNALVYTTASHTPAAPRARAVIELSRAVDRAEGIALGEAVERMLVSKLGANNVTLDPCVYRAEQPVYTPLVGAQNYRYQGQPLDVDALLAAYPPPTPKAASQTLQQQALMSPVMAALLQPPETPVEVAKVRTALASISADCAYPQWVEILFALHSTGWTCAESLARRWSMTAPRRYDAAVFDSVWQHAKPFGGISIGTLYHRARQAGAGSTVLSAGLSSNQPSVAPAARGANDYALGSLSIPTQPPPNRTYLFADVVVPGTVAVLAGAGGTAKTGLAIQLCIQGALGQRLGPIQVGSFASLMILAEETTAERDRRFGALCTGLGDADRAKVERLVHCRAEAGNDVRLTALLDGNVEPTQWVDQIIELAEVHAAATQETVGLIVIDHARLVMSGDPISSEHVTGMLRGLTNIAVATGSAVLLLAHSPKSTISKDTEADASEVFGSGAFVDHSRAAFVLHTMRPQEAKRFGFDDDQRKAHVCLSVVKANYGNGNQQWWLRKEVVQGWQVAKLVPAYLMPKGQAQTQPSLVKKLLDVIKRHPGQLSSRALRDRYAGVSGELGASEREVRGALERALQEGQVIARAPTDEERKRYRLSPNIREVLDIP